MSLLGDVVSAAEDYIEGTIGVLLPTLGVDVVAVMDSSYKQIIQSARPIKASVNPNSKMFEHPQESGKSFVDQKIILPLEIELNMVLTGPEYRNTYAAIRKLFASSEQLTIKTRAASYSNMVITAFPHEENGDMWDAIPMSIRLREVKFYNTQIEKLPASKVSANPKTGKKTDASTKKRGQQQAKTTDSSTAAKATKQASTLYKIFY